MNKHATNPHTGQPYRGWRSTKLHLALIVMGLITVGFAFCAFRVPPEVLPGLFFDYCMGLLGGAAIYSGAATWEKFRAPPSSSPELPPSGGAP